ncbi:MAG: 50S ribosomal protein L15 [Chloroflexi bacterium]|nr:50S ribosomal protein L15 [Chloroflexota bacterium]MBM3182945.1 50S ribosomal protein L15 [Chloroflexota bacterium]MBM4451124.1 50S ribosomal protein L15 [Chloroflexota bacterium]MBM4453044.1 50S ribosomal protein L15 [Chloroflexota bacterium]
MDQSKLKPPIGAKHKRKRVGRGDGSGHGSYSGRGLKGQKSRSGGGVRLGFEGGQLPLIKRLPRKRGFTNIFKKEFSIINVASLQRFAPNTEVTPDELYRAGLIKSLKQEVKILGNGELDRPLVVKANMFSATAEKKISDAGGKIERI